MPPIHYLDLDLCIEKSGAGYRAKVIASPAGQAQCDFTLPFSDLELENFLLKMGGARRTMRRIESPEMEAAKTFGSRLFGAVFAGDVRSALTGSLYAADEQQAGVRVRLHLAGAPELADLPWEFLYNPSLNRFLAMSNKTPLVRYLDLPEPIRPLAVRPPLNVLVMISSPSDYAKLNVEDEFAKLKQALADTERDGLVVLERLEDASLTALQRHLRQGDHHIFHFIGHGGFDEQTQDGVLILEDADGRGRRVSAQHIGTLLHDHDPLRLVVLNACEGARAARSDPFAGTAQTLVQQGIPAVIAMQFEISDEAAIGFTQEFYCTLATGYPVDAAVAEARKRIFNDGNEMEWGTPVLYMRSPDGKVFDVQPAPTPSAASFKPAPPPPEPVPVPPPDKPAPERPVAAPQPTRQPPTAVDAITDSDPDALPTPANLRWMAMGGGVIALLLCVAFGGWALFSAVLNPGATATPTKLVAQATSALAQSTSTLAQSTSSVARPTTTPDAPAATPIISLSTTATPPASPTATAIQSPTAINTVVRISTTAPLVCRTQPASFATTAWNRWSSTLGCATDAGLTLRSQYAAQQAFEHGLMVWRGDEDYIYALFKDGSFAGLIRYFENTWVNSMKPDSCPEIRVAAPRLKPEHGFGKVWCERSEVRDAIGAAVNSEVNVQVYFQSFQNGKLMGILEMGKTEPAVYMLTGAGQVGDTGKWVPPQN